MNVRDALREGAAALARTETPFLDASLLLADALGTDTTRLLASSPDEVEEAVLERYRSGLASRAKGLPVAYVLGYKEFWGRRFSVDRRVLVPRPDTETLVEASLRIGDALALERGAVPRVHECCVGSGCVAISLAADRPAWEVSASDISEEALEVASANASAILEPSRPGGRLELLRSDLLSALIGAGGAVFDLVAANPPYIPGLEARVLLDLGWEEPILALDGGEDGLDLIRRLAPEAARALAPGGALLVEADRDQAAEVARIFGAAGFVGIETLRDLGGRARVTSGRMPWTT
jgi:release factor glutamine methyltransferase